MKYKDETMAEKTNLNIKIEGTTNPNTKMEGTMNPNTTMEEITI